MPPLDFRENFQEGSAVSVRLILLLVSAGAFGGCGDYSSDGEAATAAGADSSGSPAATSTGAGGGTAATSDGSSAGNTTTASAEPSSDPLNHRFEAIACPQERGPGSANIVDACTADAECTDGLNGRCISPNVVGPFAASRCSYDNCFSDSDCPANEPCRCRASAASSEANVCFEGSNCRTDSDCGPGGFCSPSLFYLDSSINAIPIHASLENADWVPTALFGYFCHTPRDLCVNDSDCARSDCLPEQGCGSMACGYTTEDLWGCFRVGTH